jgi:predicted dehydrogenase
MKTNRMDRRRFVGSLSAGLGGLALAGLGVPGRAYATGRLPASDTINLGVIGVGSRGQWLMRNFLRVPGVRITALSDVYEPRLQEGRGITGENTPGYLDYRRMLDREAGAMDAVVVASPLHAHEEQVVAALDRGLHVFGEKAMAFSLDGCNRIVEAVRRNGRHYQVGHQYRYAPWAQEAVRRVQAGEIGEITHVQGYWHRNNNWRRPIPASPPAGWSAERLERLINWRLYTDQSRGLLAELGSHHIDFANWVFGAMPTAAMGSGSIVAYADGRETFDNVQCIFEYPNGRRLTFSSLLNNHKQGYQVWIIGTGGNLRLTLGSAHFYFEPPRPNSAVPEGLPARENVVTVGVETSPTLAVTGDLPYDGPGQKVEVEDDMSADLMIAAAFAQTVREGIRPWADERVGWESTVPVIFGDQASRSGQRVDFAEHVAAFTP